jgi:hypothetical protein
MQPTTAGRLTLHETDRASLWYYPDKKIIHHEFRSFVHGEQFRGILERGLEAFRKYGACKWLSDNHGHGATTEEDSDWSMNTWSPRVIEAGWKYWAVVMPEKVVGQMSLRRRIKAYSERGVTVRVFTNADEAMAWLESQKP